MKIIKFRYIIKFRFIFYKELVPVKIKDLDDRSANFGA